MQTEKLIVIPKEQKDVIIIIHRHKKNDEEFPEKFKIIEEKKYGISKIIFGNFI